MKVDAQIPSFETTEWLNRKTSGASEGKPKDQVSRSIKGRLLLVHFWSIHSESSILNLSQTAELRDQRRREGLRVIAVHVPNSDAEKDHSAVREAAQRLNLTEPCALDNDHTLVDRFLNKRDSLPAYFLFDNQSKLRTFSHEQNGLEIIEDELDQLITEVRAKQPFCPECQLFLNEDAMFCSECGLPLTLPGGAHPYYEHHHSASLPTVRLLDPDPLIGITIDGKYKLTARIGEGGMSVVYRARRIHIGDEVAIKVLHDKLLKDESALARFRREARAAAMVHHSNVITIHDFGEAGNDGSPAFIVMELVKGTPLRDLLNSEIRFPIERAQRLMRGICAGVGAAHRQGMVHRDLKPENILVVAPDDGYEFEGVKVVDFGFAKLVADSGAGPSGTVVGTPFYMSPEQCLGEPLDTRSDVYSLGAMFYEIVSGQPPFRGETVSEIITKQLSDPPPPLSSSLGIPRRVTVGIMNALAKDPVERPQHATALARQLQLI
jgi:tRNA A-37 threonylcarbamoyl transferase component Bud32